VVIEGPGDEDVLQCVRDPEQRARVAGRQRGVRGVCVLQGSLLADRQEGVERLTVATDAGQRGLGQLPRAELAAVEQLPDLGDRPVGERERIGHRPNGPPPG
jgi:hypothetical protein